MTIPRELTQEERILICHGLNRERISIENELRKDFNEIIEKRQHPSVFAETRITKLESIDNLYDIIAQDPHDLGIWLYDPKKDEM